MALRLIALFKLLKGLLLVGAGFGALRLIHADVSALVTSWADRLNIDPQNRYLGAILSRLLSADARTFVVIGTGSFVYAAVLLTEAGGLWFQRRWAEYFTIIVTSSFIPLELYEAWKRFAVSRLVIIAVNVAIVAYLVHRLRGCEGRAGSNATKKGPPLAERPLALTLRTPQLCHLNCCGLRADSCEITTLTSAGPLNAVACSSALFRSFGFSTNQPLPPNASIILS
jgi:uncharacterized membrane protein (DUF2068 family)